MADANKEFLNLIKKVTGEFATLEDMAKDRVTDVMVGIMLHEAWGKAKEQAESKSA